MDEPQIRRRRPAITYGKTSRKKRTVDEIFVSSQPPITPQLPSNPPLLRVGLVKPHLEADKLVLEQTKGKLQRNNASSNLLCDRRTPPAQSQTPREITSFAQPSEEPDRSKPIDQSMLDIQCRETERAIKRPSLGFKRKRTLSVTSKIPTVLALESTKVLHNKFIPADNSATMGKRSRSARNTELVGSVASPPPNTNLTKCDISNKITHKECKANVRKPSMAPPSVSPEYEKTRSASRNTSTNSMQSLSSKIVASGNKYIQPSMHINGNNTKGIANVPCIKNSLSTNTTHSPGVVLIGDELPVDSCVPSIRLIDNMGTQAHIGKPKTSLLRHSKTEVIKAKRSRSSSFLYDDPIKPSHGLDKDATPNISAIVVSKPVLTSSRTGSRITYARERSFRVGEPADEFEILSAALPTVQLAHKRRLGEKTVTGDHNCTVDDLNPKTTVKSIHELRAAALNSRFNDDVEELFADIEGSSIKARRSGYHELSSKLRQKTFFQKFWAKGLCEKLFSAMSGEVDEIIQFLIAHMALRFLLEDSTPQSMLYLLSNGATSMLMSMLDKSEDIMTIAEDTNLQVSKAAQDQVHDLRSEILKSTEVSPHHLSLISPQILSLKVLELLVKNCRQQGNFDALFPNGLISKLIDIITPFSSLNEYPSKTLHTHSLELCLSILESYATGDCVSLGEEISNHGLRSIAKILPALLQWGNEEDLGPILILILRLNINITTNHGNICDQLLQPSLITALISIVEKKFHQISSSMPEVDRLLSVDLLVLSLGLLLNFAELSPIAREMVPSLEVKSSYPTKTGLDCLLNTFIDILEKFKDADSLEKTEANVALGYLSLVLGELCLDCEIRYTIQSKLPNRRFTTLLGVLEEFMVHYRNVEEGPYHEQDLLIFTRRLELVTTRLRSYL